MYQKRIQTFPLRFNTIGFEQNQQILRLIQSENYKTW